MMQKDKFQNSWGILCLAWQGFMSQSSMGLWGCPLIEKGEKGWFQAVGDVRGAAMVQASSLTSARQMRLEWPWW